MLVYVVALILFVVALGVARFLRLPWPTAFFIASVGTVTFFFLMSVAG